MTQENVVFYNQTDNLDADFNINFEKIWKTIWNRRELMLKVFCSVLIFFILLTFILPKKYKVTADLYINKSNNSNMLEFNPYVLDEATGSVLSMGLDKSISNEIELMKSEMVLDDVIRDNNLVYKKKFGIFPNKKEGEYLSAEDFYKKGKVLKIENVKNTNVITIQYKSKKPELAYGVVSSLIANYIELHKELNTEKSKADKKLIESEYKKIKEDLKEKLAEANGLPSQSMTGIGNLSAMSAFSQSASQAMNSIRGQYLAGEKSQIAVSEERQKLNQLAAKLEWAKMVEQMSDSSKVLVLKEPKKLRAFENYSPKLLMNIILGCIFGCLASIIVLIYVEQKSSKLTYSMLSENVIFDGLKKFNNIKIKLKSYSPKKILLISFEQLPGELLNSVQSLSNSALIYYDGTDDFIDKIGIADKIVLISKIDQTSSESYKIVREAITNQQKDTVFEILL